MYFLLRENIVKLSLKINFASWIIKNETKWSLKKISKNKNDLAIKKRNSICALWILNKTGVGYK